MQCPDGLKYRERQAKRQILCRMKVIWMKCPDTCIWTKCPDSSHLAGHSISVHAVQVDQICSRLLTILNTLIKFHLKNVRLPR